MPAAGGRGDVQIASRKEVADLAGVSEATVSRVLNGLGPVKEETKRKVLAAAQELGYVPSSIARSFARNRSGNLGIFIPFMPKVHIFNTYYFAEILNGIAGLARGKGYDILLLFRFPGEPVDYETYFQSKKIDACVILGAQDQPKELEALRKLHAQSRPYCLINQRFDGENFNLVDGDHADGSYQAVRRFLREGKRNIAFLNGPLSYSNSRDRLKGYTKALAEHGIPLSRDLLLEGNYSRTSGYALGRQIAGSPQEIDAVFAANDRMAVGLLQALAEQGIRAGRDLPVIGYDDSDSSRVTDPPLSTVHVPFFEMGELAARFVLDASEGKSSLQGIHEILPVKLILRGTTET